MTALGVLIILILLLVLLPILLAIKKHQKKNIECLEIAADAIEKFNANITTIEGDISNNFREVIAKTVVLDSKQTSIKDMLDAISKGIEVQHGKTLSAISFITRTASKTSKGGARRTTKGTQDNISDK